MAEADVVVAEANWLALKSDEVGQPAGFDPNAMRTSSAGMKATCQLGSALLDSYFSSPSRNFEER